MTNHIYTVYRTTNIINQKIYIGVHATMKPNDSYIGSGKLLKLAIEKYGKENFKKEILFEYNDRIESYLKEQELVNESFISRNDTYNIALGGNGGKLFNSISTKTKNKMSISQKNRPPISIETRKKLSISNTGKKHSQETKDKMSKIKSNMSQETKDKMSKSHTGKKLSQETKDKLSKVNIGKSKKPFTQEHKNNMSISAKNKNPISIETRKKLSLSAKLNWAYRKGLICLL